jgi:hypothetical protein
MSTSQEHHTATIITTIIIISNSRSTTHSFPTIITTNITNQKTTEFQMSILLTISTLLIQPYRLVR